MYKEILIPTDGSGTVEVAIRHGVGLAKELGAKVYGLYVIDISAFTGIHPLVGLERVWSMLEEEGKRALATVEKAAKDQGVQYELAIREGVPWREIVAVAEEKGTDLVVMGTTGRTGLNRFLLGSVAEKVIKTAPCPVMVVRK